MPSFVLDGDLEVRARAPAISRLLEQICGSEEYPSFVSDRATVFDVCSLGEEEILVRLTSLYQVPLHASELSLPIRS